MDKQMKTAPQGIFVPPIAMYAKDGTLNAIEEARYFRWLQQKGITGFFLNGSSGDATKLTHAEKLMIAETAREAVPSMFRIAGVIEPSLKMALEMSKEYNVIGVNALAVCPPFYFRMTQEAIIQYITTIADKSEAPLLLYDIPAFTTGMDEQTILTLAKHPNVIGVKDSSRNFVRFETLIYKIKSERPDFRIYIGTEELLLVSLVAGADGATVVTGGIRPDEILSIVNDWKRGDIAAARKTQLSLLEGIAEGFQGVFPSGFRKQVAALGFAVGPDR